MRPILALAALLLGGVLAREVRAASLEVSPVIVTLAPGQTASTITTTNRATTPAAIQARIYRWTQAGGEDVLLPTVETLKQFASRLPNARFPKKAPFRIQSRS